MDMMLEAKTKVMDYYNNRVDVTDGTTITLDDVYVVWFCKTLQNWKALLSTTVPDGMYYEVTFDGDKKALYLDAYKKWENVKFNYPDEDECEICNEICVADDELTSEIVYDHNDDDSHSDKTSNEVHADETVPMNFFTDEENDPAEDLLMPTPINPDGLVLETYVYTETNSPLIVEDHPSVSTTNVVDEKKEDQDWLTNLKKFIDPKFMNNKN